MSDFDPSLVSGRIVAAIRENNGPKRLASHGEFSALTADQRFDTIMQMAKECNAKRIKIPAVRTPPGERVDALVAVDSLQKSVLDAYRIVSFYPEDHAFCRTVFDGSTDPYFIAATIGERLAGEGQ